MGTPRLAAVSLAERPDLAERVAALDGGWPPFMRAGKAVLRYWGSLDTTRPEYQIALVESGGGVVAKGHAIPIAWNGTATSLPDGVDAVLKQTLLRPPVRPTTLCALAAVVATANRGRGLSRAVLRAFRDVAARHGLRDVLAPVRPTHKCLFPHTPIERYMSWTDGDGLPLDPWLRVHVRIGGRLLRPAPRSMVVAAPVADWERWCGRRFDLSGSYVIPGALQPVRIDRDQDVGVYEEPNVWVHHA